MGLDIYKNKDELIENISPGQGQTFSDEQLALLQPLTVRNLISPYDYLDFYGDNYLGGPGVKANDYSPYTLEFHVYTLTGQWITGKYIAQNMAGNTGIHAWPFYSMLFIKNKKLFDNLNIKRGQYKYILNFFRDRIGTSKNRPLFIKEISPDRTEVKLNFIDFPGIINDFDNWVLGGPFTPNCRIYEQYDMFCKWQIEYSFGTRNPDPAAGDVHPYMDTREQNFAPSPPSSVGTDPYSPPDAYLADRGIIWGKRNANISSLSYLALNFGENKVFRTANWWIDYQVAEYVDNNDIHVKLLEPLPQDIEINQTLWVTSQLMKPYVDNIIIEGEAPKLELNTLSPNFDIEVNTNTITETQFKAWNDILATNASTTQQILDKMFSGSLGSGIDLGIDFTDYKNFVHFSSAKERLANFKYKVQLVEHYTSQSGYLENTVIGDVTESLAINEKRRNAVIGSFDQFERWLYNEPTASLFTHGITGSLVPYPKKIYSGSYVLHPTTSSISEAWYTGHILSASAYDLENDNALVQTIPEFIREDPNNSEYDLFVNMMGQHFDILYTYVSALTALYTKEEHPNLGVGKELLSNVAESMGWHLSSGKQADQLWQYALGVTVSGSYQTTGSLFSEASQDVTYDVWRRIVNNLPYILKTKGTARSVHALMSTYGVPRTLLSIKEYGGPKIKDVSPEILKDEFTYAVRIESGSRIEIPRSKVDVSLSSDSQGKILGGDRSPDTIEFRVKPQAGSTASYNSDIAEWQYNTKPIYSYVQNYWAPYNGIPWSLGLQYTASLSGSNNYGRLVFAWHSGSTTGQNSYYVSSSTDWLPLFDNDWWNVRMWTNIPFTSSAFTGSADPNIYFQIQKSDDCSNCKIIQRASASFNVTESLGSDSPYAVNKYWTRANDDSKVYLGGWTGSLTGGGGTAQPYKTMFTGAFQEYREYMEVLSQDTFDIHTLNPTSYVGNNPTSSYYTLVRHYTLGTEVKAKDYSLPANQIISSSHPNQTILDWQNPQGDGWNSYASASNFPSPVTGDSFNREVERYCIKVPSLGATTLYSNKIRTETDTLTGPLSPSARNTVAAYDRAPIDSNLLGIFYSITDQINSDIFDSTGFFELDDYIGDPAVLNEYNYPDLVRFAHQYWKKYTQRNDINAFIRIFSLFDFALFAQIKQALPARVNPRVGLLIEPNVLERSKVPTPIDFQWNNRPVFGPNAGPGNEVQQLLSDYDISAASIISPTASILSLWTASLEPQQIYTITGSQENIYTCSISASRQEKPADYAITNLIQVASGYRSNEGLISESIDQGIIPYGTTEMPLFITEPFTSSLSVHDPRNPKQLYISDQRKSYIYKRITYHYGPMDRVSHYYPLNNFKGSGDGISIDQTKHSFNSEQFVQIASGSDTAVVISGSQFRAAGGPAVPSNWRSRLFPIVEHNYFSGSMMYFSSSNVGYNSAHQENGREYVQIPSLTMPSMGVTGSWSISFLVKETSGSYNTIRSFMGSDMDTGDAHPGTQKPFIAFSSGSVNNGLYFRDAAGSSLYFSSSVDSSAGFNRTDLNHFAITYTSGAYTAYANGNKLNTIPATATTTSLDALGSGYNNSGASNKNTNGFTGQLGQVRFYDNHALTEEEIYWLNLYPQLRANRDTKPNLNGQLNVNNAKRENAGLFTSTSLAPADYYDDFHLGWENRNYNGSRLTGADFNINSNDTPDSGPVVSITIVNKEAILAESKSDRLLKIGRKLGGFFKRNS